MDEELDNPTPQAEPATQVDDALLADTMAGLAARGESTRRFECMQLPTPLLNDLVRRLISHSKQTEEAVEWLIGECGARNIDAPGRSSIYRFARVVREEYRLAYTRSTIAQGRKLVEAMADGNAEVLQKAAEGGLMQHVVDEILEGRIDTKRFMPIVTAVRVAKQNSMDQSKADAAVRLAEARAQKLELDIEELKRDFAARQKQALEAASKAAASGASGTAVADTIRRTLGLTEEAA